MFRSFARVALSAIFASTYAEVIEMTNEKQPEEWFEGYEYSVVSFYDSSEDSQ